MDTASDPKASMRIIAMRTLKALFCDLALTPFLYCNDNSRASSRNTPGSTATNHNGTRNMPFQQIREDNQMYRTSRKRLLLASLVIFAFVALTAVTSANHSWNGFHWARQSNPFTVQLGDNVSGAWDSVLGTTASDWSQSTVLNTVIVPGGA